MLTATGVDATAPDWAASCEATFARRLAEPDRFASYVVQVGDEVVSGGVGWLEEHLPVPGRLDGRRGVVASMSTAPGHLRQGYARQVFGSLMGWFAQAGVQRVDLRATEAGRALYEQYGFRVLGGATMTWTDGDPPPGLGTAG